MLLAIPLGLFIGLTLGALGGGGSILTVPGLVYLLHQPPHAATTGSLLVVGVSALAGAAAHWRTGRVRVAEGVTFGLLGIAGSYAGSRLSASVDPHLLLAAFAALMLLAATAMLRRRSGDLEPAARPAADNPPDGGPDPSPSGGSVVATFTRRTAHRDTRRVKARGVKLVVAATAVGLLTGFFGVGGGFVVVPALVLVLGFEMPVAVGTSLLVIAVNSAAALVARAGGHVRLDWSLMAVFAGAAVVGSFAGNRVASRINPARLTVGFAVLLVVVALYTAARSVPHLV